MERWLCFFSLLAASFGNFLFSYRWTVCEYQKRVDFSFFFVSCFLRPCARVFGVCFPAEQPRSFRRSSLLRSKKKCILAAGNVFSRTALRSAERESARSGSEPFGPVMTGCMVSGSSSVAPPPPSDRRRLAAPSPQTLVTRPCFFLLLPFLLNLLKKRMLPLFLF